MHLIGIKGKRTLPDFTGFIAILFSQNKANLVKIIYFAPKSPPKTFLYLAKANYIFEINKSI